METSGFFDPSHITGLVQYTDWFLWDFKDSNPVRHKEYIGTDNAGMFKNLALLDAHAARIILRCIMLKGVNMEKDHYHAIAKTYASLKHCAGVELLPYHAYGSSKSSRLGHGDSGVTAWIPGKEDMERARKALHGNGVPI